MLVYACRLVEKGYKQGTSSIYIHCNNEEEANEIDALLWTFRQESFVPHSLISKENGSPIEIGWQENQASNIIAIVNLSNQIQRLVKIVIRSMKSSKMMKIRKRLLDKNGSHINQMDL